MGFALSPSVNVNEIDLTLTTPAVSTTIGAIVADLEWGPARDVTLIGSEKDLVEKFGLPTNVNYKDWWTANNFLDYTSALNVVRVTPSDATNGVSGTTAYPLTNTTSLGSSVLSTSVLNVGNRQEFDVLTPSSTVAFFAKYPGIFGNRITVHAINGAYVENSNQTLSAGTDISVDSSGIFTGTGTTWFSDGVLSGDKIIISGSTSNDGTYTVTGSVTDTLITVSESTTAEAGLANVSAIKSFAKTWGGYTYKGFFDYSPTGSQIWFAILLDGNVVETFYLSQDFSEKDNFGASMNFAEVLNTQSKYIWVNDAVLSREYEFSGVTEQAIPNGVPSTATHTIANILYEGILTKGSDGVAAPVLSEYQSGWDLFASPDNIDINICLQGGLSVVGKYILENIVTVRKDCMVCMSPEYSDVVGVATPATNLTGLRASTGVFSTSSSYGVIDGNYKYQYDKYNETYRWIPLNGDVGGLLAATATPWQSPAGFNRGHIKNVTKLAFYPSKAQMDELYSNGINIITTFKGEGTILFGDKTAQTKPSAFDQIGVRRLFILLEKTIATAAKYQLFELNTPQTRNNFVGMVEPYLRGIKGGQGIEDFKVVADNTNNTAQVLMNKEFVADIYIKPNYSINYIYLNFVAVRSGVDLYYGLLTKL